MNLSPFTSVTRWLLVVIGCVVLATAQPMSAADAEAAAPRASDTIIYPKSVEKTDASAANKSSSGSSYLLVLAVVLAGAGAWVMLQKRRGNALLTRGPKKLQVEETRPLGNRQYLVVANYDGKKFLLGVTTGQIQMLAPLESSVEEKVL
jgi:flagellar protein FliO/FliZ